jgi:prolyl 4-hydroxylase
MNDDTTSNHYDTNDKDRLWNYFVKYDIVSHHLKVQNHMVSNTQPWAFFSTTGQRIAGELDGSTITTTTTTTTKNNNHNDNDDDDDTPWMYTWDVLKKHGMILLYEGGNWMWPGVRIGYSRMVQVDVFQKNNDNTMMEIETLSLTPLVVSVKNFITTDECNHIQTMAEPFMEYSQVTLMDKDEGRPASDFRTSQSTFLEAGKDVILNALEDRTASLTRIPKNHQEFTQVLRYQHGEQYLAHLDWFDKQMYQNDEYTLELIQHGKRNRLATVFWYLSNVEQGGETAFPLATVHSTGTNGTNGTDSIITTTTTDSTMLQVKPEKGKVIIFYSLLANGTGDPLSLHGAHPVKEGIKWAANKWIWNAPMDFV